MYKKIANYRVVNGVETGGTLYEFIAHCTCAAGGRYSFRAPCIDRIIPPEFLVSNQSPAVITPEDITRALRAKKPDVQMALGR